jgi:hypothetical protein
MADTPKTSKKSKTAKAKPGTTSAGSRAQRPLDLDDDGDLRSQIARRAYEISQAEDAGHEEENWLRAERELSGKHR